MTTILYSEAAFTDPAFERELFGPEVEIIRRDVGQLTVIRREPCHEVGLDFDAAELQRPFLARGGLRFPVSARRHRLQAPVLARQSPAAKIPFQTRRRKKVRAAVTELLIYAHRGRPRAFAD